MRRPLTVPPVRETEQLDLAVGGQRFRVVVDHGTGPGTPLLIMNGLGARLELLQPFVDHLSGERTVIRFDAPGVGASPSGMPYRFPKLCRQIAALLDELDFHQVDVLGISWGGELAQQFAFTQSPRCRRLVLVSTSTGAVKVPAHPRVLARAIAHRRYTDPDYLEPAAHHPGRAGSGADPAPATAALRAQGTSHNRAGYFMQLGACAGWTSVPFLPFVKQRTLVLSGNQDPLIPTCNAKVIARLIPNSELEIFNGGHLGLVTEAAEHAPRVEWFLDELTLSH